MAGRKKELFEENNPGTREKGSKKKKKNDLEYTREEVTLQGREGIPSSETGRRRRYGSFYP